MKNLRITILFAFTLFALGSHSQNSVTVNTGLTNAKGDRYTVEPISKNLTTGEIKGAIIDLEGLRTETTYSDEYLPITNKEILTDESGNIIAEYISRIEYDAMGDITKTIDALGNINTTEYNSIAKVSATTDANENRTAFEYDNRGMLFKTIFPDGSTEVTQFDAVGNEIAKIDRANRTTTTIYDAINRAVGLLRPDDTPNTDIDNPTITKNFDAGGRLVSVTDARGFATTFEYNAINLRTKTIDPLGNETSFVYNNLKRINQSVDALNQVTKFEYDAVGHLIKTTFPDNTPNDDSDNLFTVSTYDPISQKIAETDLSGKTTSFEYSKGGNITAVIDALDQRTEFKYDQRGNKTSQTDANGNTTSWTYDALSRVSSKTLPEGQTENYSYDPNGNLQTKTDFNGDVTTYEYNNLNQQTRIIYADNAQVSISYTATGQISSITEHHGITSYQYDAEDRLTRIDYPDNNFIAYLYDKNSNRTQVKTANQTVDYTFDPLNRLKTITDANGVTTYTYNSVGRLATQSNANGTLVTYSYDSLNRLTNLTHTDSANSVLASYQYTLGDDGNRQHIIEASGREVSYFYDDLYRLIKEEITDPLNGNQISEFTYDKVGNRLQHIKNGETTTYVYNKNDQLLSETKNNIVTSYSYDNNGNTLAKTIDGILASSYSYNKRNQLVQAITQNNNITNTYDVNGIRLSQSVDGVVTNYLVDPNRDYAQVLEELDDTNTLQISYLYGKDLISQSNADGIYTFGYDGLGSTRLLTDVNAEVQVEYDYEVFGKQSYQFGFVENKYLYTGEQYDANLDFYYLRSRYYSQNIGRFQNMDTFAGIIGQPLSFNKYNYVLSNPANLIDPSGFFGLSEFSITQKIQGILQKSSGQASFRVVYKKSGCFLVEAMTGEVINRGVYVFLDSFTGLPYVGQTTVDFDKRLKQHIAQGKRDVERILAKFHISGNITKPLLRQFEQVIVNIFGEVDPKKPPKVSNSINALNAKKRLAIKKIGGICK